MLNLDMRKGRAKIAAELNQVRVRKNGDSWDEVGKKGVWRRAHRSWRRSLFTPMKVAKGPRHGGDLGTRRLTQGVKRDGSRFEVVDNWRDAQRSHLLLPFEWRGHTTFFTNDPADMGAENAGTTITTPMTRSTNNSDPRHPNNQDDSGRDETIQKTQTTKQYRGKQECEGCRNPTTAAAIVSSEVHGGHTRGKAENPVEAQKKEVTSTLSTTALASTMQRGSEEDRKDHLKFHCRESWADISESQHDWRDVDFIKAG